MRDEIFSKGLTPNEAEVAGATRVEEYRLSQSMTAPMQTRAIPLYQPQPAEDREQYAALTATPVFRAGTSREASQEVRRPSLLDYGQGTDPRGRLHTELDRQQWVVTMIVELLPALPLPEVEQAEALSGTVRWESPSAPPSDRTACHKARTPGPDQGTVAWRLYPERGIKRRLDKDGRVIEIRYLATRPQPGC